MKSRKNIALLWGFSVIPVIILSIVYTKLPAQVPTSFGFDGAVNAYGPRSTLWILALLEPLIALMLQFLPRIDPKRRSYAKFQRYYEQLAIFLQLFLLVVFSLVVTETLRPGTVSIGRTVTAMVGALLIVMGNMMGKIKPNYFVGIRTPWTLADPDVWMRTHSLGGKLWFSLGVLLLPCSLLLPERVFFVLLMAGLLGSTALLFVLSCLWYRRRESVE